MQRTLRYSLFLTAMSFLNIYAPEAHALQILTASVDENDGTATVTFLADDAEQPLQVSYTTQDGSAKAGQDYQASSGTLTFTQQFEVQTVRIPIIDDQAPENSESFSVVANYTIGGNALQQQASVDIDDDDSSNIGAARLERANYIAAEGGKLTIQATRMGGSQGEASVDFVVRSGTATEGSDFSSPQSGTLTWADGDNSPKSIDINIIQDNIADGGEKFTVELSNPSAGFELQTPDTATVTISENAVVPLIQRAPEDNVSNVVSTVCSSNNFTGALATRCNEFNNLNATQQQQVVQQITPNQATVPTVQGIKLAGSQTRNLQNRLGSLRSSQFTKAVNVSFNGVGMPFGQLADAAAGRQQGGSAGDDNNEELRFFDGRLGFFFQGRLQKSDKTTRSTAQGTETGFNSETRTATAGMDYRFSDALVMGLAIGYDSTDLGYSAHLGSQNINAVKGMFYGSYYLPHDFYVDWVAGYGSQFYTSRRNIVYSIGIANVNGAAKGSPTGNQYDFSISLGKDFSLASWQFSPYGRFEYLDLSIDGYRERGTTGWELAYNKTAAQSLTTTAGSRLSYAWSLPWGVLTPAVRGEWVHEYSNGSQQINARFINATAGLGNISTAARTLSPDRDYFNLEGSLTATLPEGRAAFLRYESRLGQNTISSHTVEAGVRIPF
jgi:uncharacterized protein with beta-barrel porin domain